MFKLKFKSYTEKYTKNSKKYFNKYIKIFLKIHFCIDLILIFEEHYDKFFFLHRLIIQDKTEIK